MVSSTTHTRVTFPGSLTTTHDHSRPLTIRYIKTVITFGDNALPTALMISYTFLPAAVAVIFKTRSCEEFDDGSSLLREE